MEVVVDHGDALPEADDVVVTGDKVKALVVNLAENISPFIWNLLEPGSKSSVIYQPSMVSLAIMYLESLCSMQM